MNDLKYYCKKNDITCSNCKDCPRGMPPVGNCILLNDACIALLSQTLAQSLFDKPVEVKGCYWKCMSVLEAIQYGLFDVDDIDMEDFIPTENI